MVDMMKYPDEFKREALKLAAQRELKWLRWNVIWVSRRV